MSGAGLSTLSAHRRPLATAAAAGGLLFALWFVPSAHADPEDSGVIDTPGPTTSQHEDPARDPAHQAPAPHDSRT